MKIQTQLGTVRIEGLYTVQAYAVAAASRCGLWVVLGAPGQFYTVKPRDAARLESAGYEIL